MLRYNISMKGYYKMPRGWMESPYLKQEKFTERCAMLWLLEQAVFKDQTVRVAENVVELKRGQLAFSLRFLAKKWRWTYSKVQRFIKKLEKYKIIESSNESAITVISICNYDEMQDYETYNKSLSETKVNQKRISDESKKNKGGIKENKREGDFSSISFKISEEVNIDQQDFYKIMSNLQQRLGVNKFASWFSDVTLVEVNEADGYATIKLKSRFVRDYCRNNFLQDIEACWKKTNPKIKHVNLVN